MYIRGKTQFYVNLIFVEKAQHKKSLILTCKVNLSVQCESLRGGPLREIFLDFDLEIFVSTKPLWLKYNANIVDGEKVNNV